ncbi:acetyl-CoA acetyltransferase [Nocardia wallacei]|uniref:acetyl-CoA acetyltransferase n=1 Tax=Nocardia wallacei TaxID=480035 RepID=UPI00245884AF|nr:acetyl-CoA acetyltransferase [Nocardia wallacei]
MGMSVYVLGGGQTDFARRWANDSDRPVLAMLEEAVASALHDAAVTPEEVQCAHVANFNAERFAGQSHLGAMMCMLYPQWSQLPASRHEAACASGSVALLAAMAQLEAGHYDVVVVAGAELMRNMPGQQAARYLGSAAWVPDELSDEVLPWPGLFARIAEETANRYGLDHQHLNAIAEINRTNALRNPWAQTRRWDLHPHDLAADDQNNPVVAGRLRKSDCGRITDGAAAVVLANSAFTEQWARRQRPGTGSASVIRGWGHHSAPLPLAKKFELSRDGDYLFPNVRAAITDAYSRAGIGGPDDLDVIELHDCFTITEYVAIDHFGLTSPGRAWEAIEDGRIRSDGGLPINPSGGLIGAGHPVGATGVRMVLDAHRQVTGTADDYQIPGARTAATLNIGGSASTAVSVIVGIDE